MSYIPDVWGDRRVQGALGAAVLAGLGAGAALGYILAKRKFKKQITTFNVFNAVRDGDVNPNQLSFGFNPHYTGTNTESSAESANYSLVIPNDPDEAVVIVPKEDVSMEDAEVVDVEVTTIREPDPDWDYEVEVAARNPREPYVIHVEEYMTNELGYRQETVTYYAGDDIMADPAETPIYGYVNLMGELKFGHGSGSPDVVYIRNDGIHMEWEVCLDAGHYSIEVEGHTMEEAADEELRHSHMPRVPKFRRD